MSRWEKEIDGCRRAKKKLYFCSCYYCPYAAGFPLSLSLKQTDTEVELHKFHRKKKQQKMDINDGFKME